MASIFGKINGKVAARIAMLSICGMIVVLQRHQWIVKNLNIGANKTAEGGLRSQEKRQSPSEHPSATTKLQTALTSSLHTKKLLDEILPNQDCFSNASPDRLVTVHQADLGGQTRLGNKIFMVASAFGIACKNNATLVLQNGEN